MMAVIKMDSIYKATYAGSFKLNNDKLNSALQ
jgi:hypothetical protein